jgi:hypothetical protein
MLDATRACHFGFCDRLGPGRRVSPLFVQWAHEVSNERRAQVVVPAGIEPARRHYFQAHRRGAYSESHGAERYNSRSSRMLSFSWGRGEGEMPYRPKSSLTHAVLVMPTAISPALPDRATCWASAFVAHGSTRFCIGSTMPCGQGCLPFCITGRISAKIEIECGQRHQFFMRHLRWCSNVP